MQKVIIYTKDSNIYDGKLIKFTEEVIELEYTLKNGRKFIWLLPTIEIIKIIMK